MGQATSTPITVNTFLQAVENNNFERVKKLCKSHPQFITEKGNITLISGQAFVGISPIQLAAWSLNGSLAKAIIDYAVQVRLIGFFSNPPLPDEMAMYNQLNELKDPNSDIFKQHGAQYAYDDLVLPAYAALSKADRAHQDTAKAELVAAQRSMPKHFAIAVATQGTQAIDYGAHYPTGVLSSLRYDGSREGDRYTVENVWYKAPENMDPYSSWNFQGPEISDMIRPNIYLKDSDILTAYKKEQITQLAAANQAMKGSETVMKFIAMDGWLEMHRAKDEPTIEPQDPSSDNKTDDVHQVKIGS